MVRISLITYFSVFFCVTGEYFESVLDDMMTLGWDIDQTTEEILITIKCQLTIGYCAFGLGSMMSGSDIYAVVVSDSVVTVQDYFSTGHTGIDLDTSDSGLSSITKVSSTVGSSSVEVVFKRNLDTGDSKDNAIVPNEEASIIWAYVDGSSGIVDHNGNACNFYIVSDKITWTATDSSSSASESNSTSESSTSESSAFESLISELSSQSSSESSTESSSSSFLFIELIGCLFL